MVQGAGMNGSNWTGKVHRTLQSAFGPHTDERIDSAPAWHDEPAALLLVAAITVLACWAVVSALFVFCAP